MRKDRLLMYQRVSQRTRYLQRVIILRCVHEFNCVAPLSDPNTLLRSVHGLKLSQRLKGCSDLHHEPVLVIFSVKQLRAEGLYIVDINCFHYRLVYAASSTDKVSIGSLYRSLRHQYHCNIHMRNKQYKQSVFLNNSRSSCSLTSISTT